MAMDNTLQALTRTHVMNKPGARLPRIVTTRGCTSPCLPACPPAICTTVMEAFFFDIGTQIEQYLLTEQHGYQTHLN